MKIPLDAIPPGGPYTARIVADGRFVFVSGQGPVESGVYVPSLAEQETELALRNVGAILEQAGTGPEHVVSARVYLADLGDFEEMNRAFAHFFPEPRPSRTTIGASCFSA